MAILGGASIVHTSSRPLVSCALVAIGLACTPGEDGSTTTILGEEFVIEGDGDENDDVSESESGGTTDDGTDTTDDASDAPETCGNGQIDPGEDCDGSNLGGATCESEGFDSGTLECSAGCNFDISDCDISDLCGNGVIDGNEECDGANLGGATCVNEGYACGDIACFVNCSLNTNGCADQTYQGFEGGAVPAGWTTGGSDPWADHYSPGTHTVNTGNYSLRSGFITDNENSWLQVVVDFPIGGAVQFWHLIASESGSDFGIFEIDGVMQDQWSGFPGDGSEYEVAVGAGEHTLRWTFEKDDYGDGGYDRWHLDDVTFVGGCLP